ncbi:methyl-accepting chemotaxis protein [Geminocystis sp. GBBB08]|uniref:HAMP domain-containing methyl-accepting chemotaxis protein n=1 Tax=Geminocystis sp. GBBB08 TaxID=2604140 RepID=UPI0027E2D8D7|nr:methyl-accepting chemotaxis protein [Geminocystis sp. GBBB08]MBL1208788.1 chemotaxis protein [Geminocystis sp. GBBB08]
MATGISKGLKIRYWIGIGYAIPIILSVIAPVLVVRNIGQLKEAIAETDNVSFIMQDVINLTENVQISSRATRGYLLNPDQTSLDNFKDSIKEVQDTLKSIQKRVKNEEQIKRLDEFEKVFAEMTQLNQDLLDVARSQGNEAAIKKWIAEDGRAAMGRVTEILDEFEAKEKEIFEEYATKQNESVNALQKVVLLTSIIIVAGSLTFAFIIYFNITRRLNDATAQIATSSTEIAATIEQQDRTSSQQAASVNETTTTMDELGASSRQSSEQAESAANAAREALQLAENGDHAVQQTLSEMNELKHKVGAIAEQIMQLSEQTNQIGSISQLVSDIANRTNMLALNAAVEAVRAGEHGKGFAVVAAEIRKLADQSKQSAEKINGLVSQIQNSINTTVMVTDEGTKTVDSGMQIAQNTALAFAGVKESVNNVVMNNQQIALNIRQQSTAFEQVLTAMNAINQGARETSAGITQTRIGTQKLNDVTKELKELV